MSIDENRGRLNAAADLFNDAAMDAVSARTKAFHAAQMATDAVGDIETPAVHEIDAISHNGRVDATQTALEFRRCAALLRAMAQRLGN